LIKQLAPPLLSRKGGGKMKSRLEKRKEKTLSKLGYATKFVIAVTNLVKALTELLKAIL